MTTSTCKTIRSLLVDYADDDLRDAESTAVHDHLRDCEACRADLSHLQRSLEYARAIWQESARVEPPSATDRMLAAKKKSQVAMTAAAALTVIATGALLLWRTQSSAPLDPTQDQVARNEHRILSHEIAVEISEIESLIAREAQSARLAASSEFLAAQPSLADYREHADLYLATAYENSPAGKQAKQRLHETSTSSSTGT